MARPRLLIGPCCHDGISAKLIEKAGFPFTFMSGFTSSAAVLGAPDVGLMTYSEMIQTGRNVHEATQYIPVIGDGDTGYGNPLNVKRTVAGYANAGFAGILIEDQVWPKSCGHVRGKKVVSRKEAIQRIAAAVEARDTGTDIAILARTDARQAESLEEALWRIQAFFDVGADILFIDALETEEEMEKFCKLVPSVPKLANMLEGGKTPILTPKQLENIGFKLAAYPLSLFGASVKAMNQALEDLRTGDVPNIDFKELQEILGFDTYFADIDRFEHQAEILMQSDSPSSETSAIEADEVVLPNDAENEDKSGVVVAVEAEQEEETKEQEQWFPSFARIRVTNTAKDKVTMDFRLPVGFLEDVSKYVPSLKDVDLRAFVTKERFPDGQPGFQFTDNDDLVEVFLE